MRHCISRANILVAALALLFCQSAQADTAQGTQTQNSAGIHMLPPLQMGGLGVCGGATAGVLYWGGIDANGNGNAINCIPGFAGDSGGNVYIGGAVASNSTNSLYIGGAGPINKDSATTLDALRDVGGTGANTSCGNNMALAKTGPNSFSCVSVSDIANVGTVTLPTCSHGLAWNGTNFTCVTPVAVSCASYGTNYALTGINADGTPACTPIPTPPVAGANPLYVAEADYTDPTTWNNELQVGIINIWHAPPGVGNVNADSTWAGCNIPDPSDDSRTFAIANNTSCMETICDGHFNKFPNIAQTDGQCAAGDTNPLCNGQAGDGVHMIMNVSCEYTQ